MKKDVEAGVGGLWPIDPQFHVDPRVQTEEGVSGHWPVNPRLRK